MWYRVEFEGCGQCVLFCPNPQFCIEGCASYDGKSFVCVVNGKTPSEAMHKSKKLFYEFKNTKDKELYKKWVKK